ncbi:radical SAM protein [Sinorhizobium medicae]|uniref:radical SAM protein n=1 Tax=Sinorhizobium medicae TaxID=110321 RepID=UPI0009DB2FEB|nr:radical SAM protein [Sinorhizobium medicae]
MGILRPKTLSIITTHHCTAACDHCCFHCTPKLTVRIPPDRLEKLIDEATEVPSIKVIAFTGGECFTLPDLDARIEQAAAYGFKTRCVSNGYWAFNPERAAKRASDFSKAGLFELNLSTGTFHAKYVPIERVAYAARAATDVGVRTLITVEAFEGDGPYADDLRNHPLLNEDIDAGRIFFQRNVWMENGGTSILTHASEYNRFGEGKKCGCKTVIDVVAVTPTLSVVACCGLHLEKIPDLHVGSLAGC